jgi:sugar lactone lactonase YvrE
VWKFSPDGKVLLTLGQAGVPGDGPNQFNQPSDVITNANGDIFVADGHGATSNARIVKFDKTGKFIKTWGKAGSGPGEINIPHSLAFDSRGRLFLADRGNVRLQIFDQEGNFLDQWYQFSRISGIFIDKNDMLYAVDSESSPTSHPGGWQRGMRIGSVKDGKVQYFIPDPEHKDPKTGAPGGTSAAEGVAVDARGNLYGAEVGPRAVKKYVRK